MRISPELSVALFAAAAAHAQIVNPIASSNPDGGIVCGLTDPSGKPIGTASPDDSDEMSQRLGGGNVINLGAGPNTCLRVACINTSGVWACNDNADPIVVDNEALFAFVGAEAREGPSAITQCGCYHEGSCQGFSAFQRFQDNWSAFVGYANCNKDANFGPFDQ